MNRIFYSTEDSVLLRLSDKAEHFKSKKGRFKVSYGSREMKNFSTLLEAFLFYITLDEEANLWHIAETTTLIERKVKLFLN